MDQKAFEAMMAESQKAAPAQPEAAPEPSLEDQLRESLRQYVPNAEQDPMLPHEGNLAAPGTPAVVEAAATGAAKGLFETKDFLFGETPPEQRSAFRTAIEGRDEKLDSEGLLTGFSSGVGQFAIGMLGLGKAQKVAEALPWFGKGLGALASNLPKTVESAKAALTGAIAFDPHEERLSNLVQDTPLANPVTRWLAADPSDGAAEGRLKSAMESIGLDATLIGTFVASTSIWKALRTGNAAEASRLVDKLEADKKAAVAEVDNADTSLAPDRGASGNVAPPALDGDVPPGGTGDALVAEDRGPQSGGGEAPAQVREDAQPAGTPSGEPGVAGSDQPSIVANPTDAADAAGTTLNSPKPRIKFTEENTEALLDGMDRDAFAVAHAGGWYQAIEMGHTFGKGEGIPYVKLNADSDVEDFMARVVDTAQSRLDNMKGGAVLTDKRVDKVVDQMATLFNADPAQVLGLIQQAGKDAPSMVANMEAGYLVANRMLQDSYALASRIRMGDFAEFGGRDAALAELRKRASLAASVYGSARSITAASGRAVRRMRAEFKVDPEAVKALNTVDADRLVQMLVDTEGDPRGLAKAVNPSLLSKITDWGQFLLINNLVSGPKTQLVNATTNAYMVLTRPLERIIGAAGPAIAGNPQANRVLMESLKNYTYLGTAFADGFAYARKAFLRNDSVMAPHRTEAYRGNQAVEQGLAFKPWESPGNLLHNTLVVAATAIGMPTRTLGFVDEAVKQTVYRSKVMAAAHMDAVEQGLMKGLKDEGLRAFVNTFVRDKVDTAFDQLGRATDPAALREAQIATFQQELLPGTIGKWLQAGVQSHPMLKLVLPFVKTPTNVLRYGWKLSPGLNLLQQEYRQALTGAAGAEARMQATGQMALGGLFMGTAAYLMSHGYITGGGTKDPKQRAELMATGWQPYSVVHENADGSKTYVPYGRFDPVAIPFGIMADLQDALHALDYEESPDWQAAAASLLFAVSNQFTNKTYLMGVTQALDALMQSDASKSQKAENWLGNTAANFIPFSAALRQLNPDPYLRDARDITDRLLATIPGYSEGVSPRRDAWGDPVRRVGLWSSDEDQIVDRETQRLILESGQGITPPQPVHNGVDLRDLTLSNGMNAFEQYQLYSGHPPGGEQSLKSLVAKFMQSKAYLLAPDGDVGTKGTKLWLLHRPVAAYRERALKMLKRDSVVRDAFRAEDLKVRKQWTENRQKAAEGNSLGKITVTFGTK